MQHFGTLKKSIHNFNGKGLNKISIAGRTEGYDGHCLRAYGYFGNRMPDIDPTSVDSINSIKKKYPEERQLSKVPTFLLTYQGTWKGMMEQTGMTELECKAIEANYHELYKVSDEWVAEKTKIASEKGYVEVAFGLRLRTPILSRTDLNKSYTPSQAQQEARTAGNALGQSYCMLNNRAAIEFMERVKNSPFKYDIKLICLIHDAIYLLIRDKIEVVHWVNQNLPDCMSWQELPDIQHPTVKLGGDLDIFWPSWANPIGLPNNASPDEIVAICASAKQKP